MDLTLDSSNNKYQIRSYIPGELKINETLYSQSVIITPNELIYPWPPQNINELNATHFETILNIAPKILLIGTGVQWQHLSPALLSSLYNAQIGIEIMDTAAACRTFNVLAAEERNVAAALLIH